MSIFPKKIGVKCNETPASIEYIANIGDCRAEAVRQRVEEKIHTFPFTAADC